MAVLSSNPADLFASPLSSPLSENRASLPSRPRPTVNFYILPPTLPEEKKQVYKPFSEASLAGLEIELTEIVGEYEERGQLYYYARHGDDLAHKFPAGPFSRQHAKLVNAFREKKAAGRLESFDPSASYIHPTSRLYKPKKTKGFLGRRQAATVSGSEDEYEGSSSSEDSSDTEYDSESDQQLHTARRNTRHARELPFSPSKSRVRTIYAIEDSDDGSDAQVSLRRSKRGKPIKVPIRVYDSSGDDDIQKPSVTRRGVRPKKDRPKRAIKPAYGVLHSVSDAEAESDVELDELTILRRHRHICERCHERPAYQLLQQHNRKPKKGRVSRKKDEFEESEDEAVRLRSLGGWVRCSKCPVVAHWKCLSGSQRDEILKAMREKSSAEQAGLQGEPEKTKKKSELDIHETTDFICGACTKGGVCMGCMEFIVASAGAAVDPEPHAEGPSSIPAIQPDSSQHQLLFRCLTCRRPAHYEHLPRQSPLTESSSVARIAEHYQRDQGWLCADCSSYSYNLDKILAWRPYPADAVEPTRAAHELPNYKDPLPREYLVKWVDRSYRRTQWVPHMWLLSTNQSKLKNFINSGSRVQLGGGNQRSKGQEAPDMLDPTLDVIDTPAEGPLSTNAFPDAEKHIPLPWKTIDRVLAVVFWHPPYNASGRRSTRVDSDADDIAPKTDAELTAVFESGKEPSARNTETVAQREARKRHPITEDDIRDVVWAFVKWEELNYNQATWDSPPRDGEPGYDAFVRAYNRYIKSRSVKIPKYSDLELKKLENRPKDNYRHHHLLRNPEDLQLGQDPGLKLLPFQVDGFNWLCNNWYNHQPCILADEMGLGKTVQIATFLGNIADKFHAMPALVVVPNSTITNWVRELDRWAPNLRVVPFYGEARAREIIRKFELHHESAPKGSTQAKFHVLVATYETLLNKGDFNPVFKSEPRWEVLIVDEGQRLKNDSSLLFKKLNELRTGQRIIMTGTPLNNNIRELFNLMNFLDPDNWNDLDALEEEYNELTEDLVKQLHNRLRPYFLRRIKSEVLELPPKNEVIIPVSMAPLQREVYRSILSHNVDLLKGLTQLVNTRGGSSKKNIHNVLMQLRKCLQHPYLYDDGIEPRGLSTKETHEKLIDASAKLRLLKALLPKLKARGHRILLFSQFVIALDIVEDFLQGEGYKFLRLDGNTNGFERQKGMDEFNRPGSDVFIYMLTTRAGGVGINLYTADTVIIFDPDFNPHQDLQAISRAYRYGQQKTCLVFKLMVKESAEERIMQIGKKKLVLDHLIVQKMDDEDSIGEDVQSILTFGAKALFESDQESRDIIYTDQDIDKLVERTEREGDKVEEVKEGAKEGALSFSFAKVWAADKDAMEDIQDDDQGDSWTQALQKITAEREKMRLQEIAASGRGVRRAAAQKANYYEASPDKEKKKLKSKHLVSDSSSYSETDDQSDEESQKSTAMDVDLVELLTADEARARAVKNTQTPAKNGVPTTVTAECGLCGYVHGEGMGQCFMTENSGYLAEFREMLIKPTDEPWEIRSAAIRAIDEALHRRGHLSLIAGQPLHPLREHSILEPDSAQQSSSLANSNPASMSLKRPASPTGQTVNKKAKPAPS